MTERSKQAITVNENLVNRPPSGSRRFWARGGWKYAAYYRTLRVTRRVTGIHIQGDAEYGYATLFGFCCLVRRCYIEWEAITVVESWKDDDE